MQAQNLKRTTEWFAWHPVKLKDGRWAWLENVKRTTLWTNTDGYEIQPWMWFEEVINLYEYEALNENTGR